MILRTIQCVSCNKQDTEKTPNSGWHGWGHIAGVTLNGHETPTFCPDCLTKIMGFVDDFCKQRQQ